MKLKLTRVQEILDILSTQTNSTALKTALDKYHPSDIADALQELNAPARKKVYSLFDMDWLSEVFTYLDNVSTYLSELSPEQAVVLLKSMDADDAIDVLEDIEDIRYRNQLMKLLDGKSSADIRLIVSFPEDTVGHMMTTNFITIPDNLSVKEAMREVIRQAPENDNINIIYVLDWRGVYAGAIALKDLIIAREHTSLDEILKKSYPCVFADDQVDEIIEQLKDYSEDSIPVLDASRRIVGIVTSDDIVEAIEQEMSEDYAKLAGLTAEEDLRESLWNSMKKRLPWLVLLLGLGLVVSSVVGVFESIVSQVAVVICFQSLILDMAGNVGTQSLAVTIRVLMDEGLSGKDKFHFVCKEMRVGGTNGLLLGTLSFACVGVYLHFFKGFTFFIGYMVAGCVGLALFLTMVVSSLVGTIIPLFFHKIHVDPAIASGPLITTINDLVAVIVYYGLAGLLLVRLPLIV